ncbi:RES family NAD+ phosphorylase [Allopontixanthobacter sp.]|uniref:RES family NAD+ phosphorylase n=1 Tax=Allopontixanthobacter sp. TaxID=2906452 RepID=UPI002ABB198C|nr:RES family NAD+ phosphorylase [Allopontixanthobacter sp.]MDZ4307111.1 RES family NAD+ phosphorylase [Allopontixanthobacter sp.]
MELVPYKGVGYRLIPSRFPPVPVYAGLVANDRFGELVGVENLTNPRLQSESRLLEIYGNPDSPQLQNWNLAPFKYINPEGSRFFEPTRPALELATDIQTALAIAVRRRELFLRRTSEPPIGLDMRMLKTPVEGSFADLRHLPDSTELTVRREAANPLPEDAAGVLFRAHERPFADCLAVTDKNALGRSVQTVHYRFEWDGERIVSIYAFNDRKPEIDPDDLFGQEQVLAA